MTRLIIGLVALVCTSPAITAQTATSQSASPIRGFADSVEMIRDLLDRGRGIEAENVARALLARVESAMGRDVLEVAEVLDLLGRAVRRSSKVKEEEKKALAERAVAIKERVLGPWHAGVATSLTNLALQRTLAADPAAAKRLLERALAIREKAFGPDHVSVAATLQSLAGLLMTMRDDAGARTLLERALRIRETTHGAEHVETIRTLFKIAIFQAEILDYAGARQRFERALWLAENALGPRHPLVFDILLRLAIVLSEGSGDYAGAAQLNERLLAMVEETFGPEDLRLRYPLGNLALDLREAGEYARATAMAQRALAIAERAHGPKHADVADGLHTLATVLAAQGSYGDAMRLFERATRINEEVLRPPDREISRAAWFIRDLFPVSGYGSDDAALFEEAVAIRERDEGLAHPRTAESLTNLAAALSGAEDYERTRPLFERALASLENVRPDHPDVASAATNLAHVLVKGGNHLAASALYERALDIWQKSLGPDHPKVATALLNLAGMLADRQRDADVGPLLRRALAIQQKALGPDHPAVADTLNKLSELALRTGTAAEAFATAARAEEIAREHMRLTARTLSERQALAYASSAPSALDMMLSVASTRAHDSETSIAAWNAVIRARGMVLDEMAARHRVVSATEDTDIAALTRALAFARQRLAAVVVRGIRNDPPDRYRRLLDQARREKDSAEGDLAEKSARFREDQSRKRVALRELSTALPDRSALVGYVRYRRRNVEPSYLAFVLRSGDSVPSLVPLGSAAKLDGLIVKWRQQLNYEAMAANSTQRGEAAYRRVAGELRQEIWDPLVAHVSNATRVFVVADGALHHVSLAALPTTGAGYLVETGPLIHYLSAERDLVSAETGRRVGEGLLALGGPAFDEVSLPSIGSEPTFRSTRSPCSDFQSVRFDPLPASVKEVDQVVTLWSAARGAMAAPETIRLTGTAASESAFKAEAAGRRVLHLATHGFFLGRPCASAMDTSAASGPTETSAKIARENPLLLSGLVLAGANHRNAVPPNRDDGVLTAEEVATLNLSGVEWAVLSGCDTGLGEVMAGEGVFGLRRAFQVAGARTVIMSLWPVEDHTTRQWMTALYEGRLQKKLSTADAVREASLAALRQRRANRLSAHPFHWAAFVAAGDWH